MRKATALASIGVLLVVLATPVQAGIVVNETIDLNLEVFIPCANGGLGEIVILNGPLHVLITFNINDNNVSGKMHFQPQGISGMGVDTGDKYQATGVTQEHFKESFMNGQVNATFVNNFRIIGQGPGNNFLIHENFHLSINANGETTVVRENFRVECK